MEVELQPSHLASSPYTRSVRLLVTVGALVLSTPLGVVNLPLRPAKITES